MLLNDIQHSIGGNDEIAESRSACSWRVDLRDRGVRRRRRRRWQPGAEHNDNGVDYHQHHDEYDHDFYDDDFYDDDHNAAVAGPAERRSDIG